MKFGKRLRMQIEDTLPEWRNKFLSYKELKKRLKSLAAPECFTEAACEASTNPDEETSLAAPVGANADSPAMHCSQAETTGLEKAEVSPGTCAGLVDGRGEGEKVEAARKEFGEDFWSRAEGGVGMRSGDGTEQTGANVQGAGGLSSSRVQGALLEPQRGSELPNGDLELGFRGSLQPGGPADGPGRRITKEEEEFIRLLNNELEKFNNFFIEKEEEYVIRLQELKERIEKVSSESGGRLVFRGTGCPEEVMAIRQEVVAFHGEMVLLENYSSLNYMGLVKILKKHDKRMGTVLRLPFIQTVLHQPFYTTELLSKLVRECEAKLRIVFPPSQEAEGQASAQVAGTTGSTGEEGGHWLGGAQAAPEPPARLPSPWREEEEELALPRGEDVDHIYRSTLAALKTLQEMRGTLNHNLGAAAVLEEGNGSGVSSLTKAGQPEGGSGADPSRQLLTSEPREDVPPGSSANGNQVPTGGLAEENGAAHGNAAERSEVQAGFSERGRGVAGVGERDPTGGVGAEAEGLGRGLKRRRGLGGESDEEER